MATLMLFKVEFQAIKAGKYRRDAREVIISAASAHPKDILSVLTADITLPAGETFDILSVRPIAAEGTEGSVLS